MKTSYTLGIIGLLIGILIFSASPSFTYQDGAPVGRTNAPGEMTCNDGNCHFGNSLNSGTGNLAVELLRNGSAVSKYSPGETYTVKVELTDQNMNAAGYQLTALDDSNERAGTFQASGNSQIQMGRNRQYLTHTSPATSFEGNTQTWELTWEAPTSDKGAVTFYAAGNAANGNGRPTGDFIYASSDTVEVDQTTSVKKQSLAKKISVYPNPVQSKLNLDLPGNLNGALNLQLVGINGKSYTDFGQFGSGSDNNIQISIPQNLKPGLYLLKLSSEDQNFTHSILIQ